MVCSISAWALSWSNVNSFEKPIDVFRAGLALVPESPQGHNNLGGALAASGRTAEAIAEFEQALRLDPNLVSARRNLELLRPQK